MATPTVTSYYARINAIGAITLSVATLIAGLYLLISIARQGHGKLRVRLLLGMVVSDLVLGAIVLPPEIAYISGNAFVTDTPVCDAMGFLLTTALFTQHLWTLAIAVATFCMLKYPLSRITSYLDKFSWACWPLIWGVSALHSGLWYRYYGFVGTGTLCYYGTTDSRPDPSLLVQFIPRAFVFISIIALYSCLFNFLRRPDTINISSHYTNGNEEQEISHRPGRLSIPMRWKNSKDHGRAEGGRPSAPQILEPWEQVSFVNVGGRVPDLLVSSEPHTPNTLDLTPTPKSSRGLSVSTNTDSDKAFPLLPPALSPVLSNKDELEEPPVPDFVSAQHRERQDSQSLAAFFQEYQITTADADRAVTTNNAGPPPISAAQYFNRQASLLMLYFPLAYLLVFSVSLIRLIYAMVVPGTPNQILLIISTWMVLSVGFIDGVVYGLAEFVVKRRVRKKMPDRF